MPNNNAPLNVAAARPRRLVLRLSSLGDVILSSSCLQIEGAPPVDWAVAQEYAAVLRGHPGIRRLWEFDRRTSRGARGWFAFARSLWSEGYDEVYDLHGSLRSGLLHLFFVCWSLRDGRRVKWRTATKQRFRSWGFIVFKKYWPRRWLSRLQVEVFARTVGGAGRERPDLRHLLAVAGAPPVALQGKRYLCVMPGSNWPGKTWEASKYLDVLRVAVEELSLLPVVLGQPRDSESVALLGLLKGAGLPHESGLGQWTLPQVAQVLAGAVGYIGSDTGLGLLAEAVGIKVLIIYGPTAPGLGFEPWREGSRTAGSDIGCRPCGKIGNRCYRITRRHACLREFEPQPVIEILRQQVLGR